MKAVLEAIVYVAEEPLTAAQMAGALAQPGAQYRRWLGQLVRNSTEHRRQHPGVAGGFK